MCILTTASLAYNLSHFELTTQLAELLPDAKFETRIASRLGATGSEKSMIFAVSTLDDADVVSFMSGLGRIQGVDSVRSGFGEKDQQTITDTLFAHRNSLVPTPSFSPGALASSARRLKRQLSQPSAPFYRTIAQDDPLLLFKKILGRLQQGNTRSRNDRLSSGDFALRETNKAQLSMAEIADLEDAIPTIGAVSDFVDTWNKSSAETTVHWTSISRFSASAKRAINADVKRVVDHRMPWDCTSLSRHIPFAVDLLGCLCPRRLGTEHWPKCDLALLWTHTWDCLCVRCNADRCCRRLLDAFLRACRSRRCDSWQNHAVCFFGYFSRCPYDCCRISRVGRHKNKRTRTDRSVCDGRHRHIGSRYTLFLPSLAPNVEHRPIAKRAAAKIQDVISRRSNVTRGRLKRAIAAFVLLLVVATSLWHVRWSDDLRNLGTFDPKILADAKAVQKSFQSLSRNRVIVAMGVSEEEALKKNDEVSNGLSRALHDGKITEFRSLSSIVPSAAIQKQRSEAFAKPGRSDAVLDALANEGFVREAFSGFVDNASNPPPPLLLADITESASPSVLSAWIDSSVMKFEDQYAVITQVYVDDTTFPLAGYLPEHGVYDIDQFEVLQRSYAGVRSKAIQMLLVGLILVFAVLSLRYRSLTIASITIAPAIAGAVGAIGFTSWFTGGCNLMHVMGVVVVLSVGVDYGVFLVEGRGKDTRSPIYVGITLAFLTTIVAFGSLAISAQPALRALGSTIAIGALLSAAVALFWLPGRISRRPNPPPIHPISPVSVLALCALVIGGCTHTTNLKAPNLVPPRDTMQDFFIRQRVQAKFGERKVSFDSVIEKIQDKFTIVGMTPFGTRAFVLKQDGNDVHFKSYIGRKLPFSPERILLEFHRAFMQGSGVSSGLSDGMHRFANGEQLIEEIWANGRLLKRLFYGATDDSQNALLTEVVFESGKLPGKFTSPFITLRNHQYGYTMRIKTIEERLINPAQD